MNLNLTGDNIDLTDDLKAFAEKKFQRLKSFEDHITSTHLTLNADKHDQMAEAQIHVPGHMIHAKAKSHCIRAAIDALVDKLQRQLSKYKEKQVEHR